MGTHIRGINGDSNDNGNTITTVNIDASATATGISTDGGIDGGINANGGNRRRIVWILPRANEVQFEYVKRCESCPRLQYVHWIITLFPQFLTFSNVQ